MKLQRGLIHSPLRPILRPLLRSPLVRGGGFSPAVVFAGGAAGLWLDPSDINTGFQDSLGTTPQTASGQPTGKRLDKSGRGNHVLQATGGARPEYDLISGIASDFFDGTDDTYATATFAAGALTANMDCLIAVKRTSAAKGILCNDTVPSDAYFGNFDSTPPGFTQVDSGAGASSSYFVNGTSVTKTRQALAAAMTVGSWVVVEIRNLDLSAWTILKVSGYSTWFANADYGGLILCPAQSDTMRNNLRRWLGAKVGLAL